MLGVFQARSPQEQLSFTCHLPYATCVLCTWSHLIPQQPQRRTIVSVWQRKNTQCSQALSNLLEVEQPISRRQASKLVHWTQNRAYHTILPATTPNENWKYMWSEHIEIVLIFQSLWAHLGFLFKLKKKSVNYVTELKAISFWGSGLHAGNSIISFLFHSLLVRTLPVSCQRSQFLISCHHLSRIYSSPWTNSWGKPCWGNPQAAKGHFLTEES